MKSKLIGLAVIVALAMVTFAGPVTAQVTGDDLAITMITTPGATAPAGTAGIVAVSVFNNGTNPHTGFALQYDVNMIGPVVEAYGGPLLMPGMTITYTFVTPFVIAAGPNVIVASLLFGDPFPANDTATKTVNGVPTINSFPYFEDFEAGPGFWVSGGTNNSWAHGTPAKANIIGASSGVNCWVTGGLTGQYPNSEQSQIVSPLFDFSGLTAPTITFDLWWDCENVYDGMALQSSIDGGTTWQTVGAFGDPNNWYTYATVVGMPGGQGLGWSGRTTTGNGSNGWVTAMHDLPGLAGQSSVLLRFAFGTDGSVTWDGVGVDDIRIFEPVGGPGQAPQPGLASLDINNAVDTTNLAFSVASGIAGPFTTSVVGGTALRFDIDGAPSQAVVLLIGPTNAGLISFPGLGQFDIGTGLGGNGIPTGIQLVGDGTQSTLPNLFYRTTATGSVDLVFTMPAFPIGYVTTFQALLFTGGPSVIAFSNAVELNAL
ncbi:MAG: immune inhibitor A [Planctomycetes bacterium]|nr:immune inhibitor A [Planctomycetota bacterium]